MNNERSGDGIGLASSVFQVKPSQIRELGEVAFTMEGVLRLQFGESDMPTPDFIKEAASRAMAEGYTFYSENAGLPSLREALAEKYLELHEVRLDPASEILVTASGVQALNLSIRCLVNPGDEALLLTPNWPNAAAIVSLFNGNPREVPFLEREGRFVPDFDALESALTPRTRLLIYSSPSNPLGWVASPKDQRRLLDFCRRNGLWLLADEVYERIYYQGGAAPSILRIADRSDAVVVVQSFSKSYCMTGWRLGWVVSRRDLIFKGAEINEFIVSHAASMIQRAGELALRHRDDGIPQMVEKFRKRNQYCFQALASLDSVSVLQPAGAFYVFPAVEGLEDSFAFAMALLRKCKVAVAPGVAFGRGGGGSFRICTAPGFSVLEPAMERICRFLERGDW